MACWWLGCGQSEHDAVDDVTPEEPSATPPNSAAGAASGAASSAPTAGEAPDASGGVPNAGIMLEGYDRYTGAAVDLARDGCECAGLRGEALEGCAIADAHEYSGLRIDSSDSKRCFEQELAPTFPDIVECETRYMESLRDCVAGVSGGDCERRQISCVGPVPCGSLPNYTEYDELRDRCYLVLYCDEGAEAAGFRCDGRRDCVDGSDEARCE
jgi:hypothetical protein